MGSRQSGVCGELPRSVCTTSSVRLARKPAMGRATTLDVEVVNKFPTPATGWRH